MTVESLQISAFAPPRLRLGQRLVDLTLGLFFAILLAPLLLLFALLIRCTSPGPIFYSQMRVGQGNRLFRCYKLRTMHPDAEERLTGILQSDAQLRMEWESHQKLQRDPRVTRIGAWLRRSSLDELPQLWNILKGEMSLVGPRPYLSHQLASRSADEVRTINTVRPGLTGLWQTSGRSRLSFDQRVALDVTYARNCTLISDMAILLKTIPMVLSGRDAY